MTPRRPSANDDPRYHTADVGAIKAAMTRYGLSQEKLAEYSELSETTVRDALRGNRKTLATFQCIANGLNLAKRKRGHADLEITPDQLIQGIEEPVSEVNAQSNQTHSVQNSAIPEGLVIRKFTEEPNDSTPSGDQYMTITVTMEVMKPKTIVDFPIAGVIQALEHRVKPTHSIVGISVYVRSIVAELRVHPDDVPRFIQAFEKGVLDDMNVVEVRVFSGSGDEEVFTRTKRGNSSDAYLTVTVDSTGTHFTIEINPEAVSSPQNLLDSLISDLVDHDEDFGLIQKESSLSNGDKHNKDNDEHSAR